ncbi:MAG: coniferyl aldehyde dehydrogenase [Phyllobacteriaceae bacterium]|nr:coniferyl aldehyde dehydrogenase [Phyllobacteriaceae bacterium]
MPTQTAPALSDLLQRQKTAAASEPFPDYEHRRAWLAKLLALTENHENDISTAIDADFGGRSSQETRLAELLIVRAGIRHAMSHLKSWMRPKRIHTGMAFWPARNRLVPQPLGVVGVVSPWNYPFQLALAPAVAALAAGNRVMIKPSELTPRFSDLLAQLVTKYFTPEEVAVAIGDAEVGKVFVALPFDHLVFTGSTQVGRHVALAAAKNLTPVTLELGGKSPTIFDPSCDLDKAVASVAYAKLLNAGQTCIAPDYLMVPAGQGATIAAKLAAAMARLYPRIVSNSDYTAIVSDRHHQRLGELVGEARQGGAEIIEINPAGETSGNKRKFLPTLVLGADPETRLMREEIFGPVLPIVEYRDIEAAIAFVNGRDRPLALYWFGRDGARRDKILRETVSGGVTINDCLLHIAQESQPFGGVGPSGMGAYHGEWGFRAFSKEKPVFIQSPLNAGAMLRPPYGARFEQVLKLFRLLT